MTQEVFQKGKLYFTKDGQAVITGPLFHNLRLSEDFVKREMPYARVVVVSDAVFPMLQVAANREGKYSLNHVINSYLR